MDNKDQGSGGKVKSFLRKKISVQEESTQSSEELKDNKDFVRRKLLEEPQYSRANTTQALFKNIFQRILYYPQVYFQRQRKTHKRFMQEFFPFACFITFSCYIIWQMELQYDQMKRKVIATKTFKEIDVEKENEYIQRGLAANPYDKNVPIKEIPTDLRYKYEFSDDEDMENFDEDDENGLVMFDGKIGDDIHQDGDNQELSFLKKIIEKGEETDKRKSFARKRT